MTPDEAAWVREHAWTERMRHVETTAWPGHYTQCACQRLDCHPCTHNQHNRCTRGPRQSREGMIADRTGVHPACFAQPYQHVTIDGPPRPTPVAQVWLADRVCRWSCPCPCGRPTAPKPATYELVPLFDLATT
ncbi:DUF6248 family natural product biosynthesis protein [Nonomuraea sp. NPDC050394]|uniref:DUF6248 family natural product biosynthesis protein n=1 Tax=Nonomuraea sp. NPDC050394 TaxID=3364363 RepID=UPI0037A75CAF